MDAQRGWEIGLVHELATPEDLDGKVQQLTDACYWVVPRPRRRRKR